MTRFEQWSVLCRCRTVGVLGSMGKAIFDSEFPQCFQHPDTPPELDSCNYRGEVAGESHYQAPLRRIMATVPPGDDGWQHCAVILTLKAEPKNPHDANAISVWIRRHQVGYIPRGDTALFHNTFPRRKLRRGIQVSGLVLGTGERPYGVRGAWAPA